ncbi:O-acetyl-ADP-ribose deacetylase [bacterium]|nr:O-acetyl-ADP-ribose deacetylase [bacterium]
MGRLEVVPGDLTRQDTDAIVNAANTTLIGAGGVAAAIQRAAGPKILLALAALGGCPTGEARITPGFRLPARFVIHAVGPVWRGGTHREDELLASAYRHALALASENGLRSIAFPSISTGIFGFPLERASRIAVGEVKRFMAEHPEIELVRFVCFSDEVLHAYQAAT